MGTKTLADIPESSIKAFSESGASDDTIYQAYKNSGQLSEEDSWAAVDLVRNYGKVDTPTDVTPIQPDTSTDIAPVGADATPDIAPVEVDTSPDTQQVQPKKESEYQSLVNFYDPSSGAQAEEEDDSPSILGTLIDKVPAGELIYAGSELLGSPFGDIHKSGMEHFDLVAGNDDPRRIKSTMENINTWNSDIVASAVSIWDKPTRDRLRVAQDQLTGKIIETIRAEGHNVLGASKGGEKTADGTANLGDIIILDENGDKRIVGDLFIETLWRSKFENIGSASGVVAGSAAGAKTLAATGNPFAAFLVGGTVGLTTGATMSALGRGADLHVNAWSLKKDLDNKRVLAQMVDAGTYDMLFGLLPVVPKALVYGKGKAGRLAKGIHEWYTTYLQNPKAAAAHLKELGLTKQQEHKLLDNLSARSNTPIDKNDPENLVRAWVEQSEGADTYVSGASKFSGTKGAAMKKQISEVGIELRKLFKGGENLTTAAKAQIDDYVVTQSRLFGATERVASDLIDPKWTWDFDTTVLNSLLEHIESSKTLKNSELLGQLEDKILKIRSFGIKDVSKETGDIAGKVKFTKDSQKSLKARHKKLRLEETTERKRILKEHKLQKQNLLDEIDAAVANGDGELAASLRKDLTSLTRTRELEGIDESIVGSQYAELRNSMEVTLKNLADETKEKGAKEIAEIQQKAEAGEGNKLRNMQNLLDLRQMINKLSRRKDLVSDVGYQDGLKSVVRSIDAVIKDAAENHMRNGKQWHKLLLGTRIEYASSKQMQKNKIYLEMQNPNRTPESVMKEFYGSLNNEERTYAEIADRLKPQQRKNMDQAMVGEALNQNIVPQKVSPDIQAVDYLNAHEELKNMPLRDPLAKRAKRLLGNMAEKIRANPKLMTALQSNHLSPDGTGIGSDPIARAQVGFMTKYFGRILAKVGATSEQREKALIYSIAKIMDNPTDSKSIKVLLAETKGDIPAADTWNYLRDLQSAQRNWGSKKTYTQDVDVYGRSAKSKGGRIELSLEEGDIKGNVKNYKVPAKSIAGPPEIEKKLKRPFSPKDIRDPDVERIMKEENFMGITHKGKVYMFPGWEP